MSVQCAPHKNQQADPLYLYTLQQPLNPKNKPLNTSNG